MAYYTDLFFRFLARIRWQPKECRFLLVYKKDLSQLWWWQNLLKQTSNASKINSIAMYNLGQIYYLETVAISTPNTPFSLSDFFLWIPWGVLEYCSDSVTAPCVTTTIRYNSGNSWLAYFWLFLKDAQPSALSVSNVNWNEQWEKGHT